MTLASQFAVETMQYTLINKREHFTSKKILWTVSDVETLGNDKLTKLKHLLFSGNQFTE